MASATSEAAGTVRRKYQAPPVVEAVARLVLAAPIPWTITTPGLIYERVRKLYPTEPEGRSLMHANLQTAAIGGQGAAASFAVNAGPPQVVFQTEARDRLLLVGDSTISLHMLPPHAGWEDLERRLFEAVELVGDLIPKDAGVAQLSVRYINRVEIPEVQVQIAEYMTIAFTFPPAFPEMLGAFLDRAELHYADEPTTLAFTFGSIDAAEGHSAFILDLDIVHNPAQSVSLDEARRMLAGLKEKESAAFESLLTDRLRAMFGEIHDGDS